MTFSSSEAIFQPTSNY